jgi:transcriptional regulator of heat shock response
MSSSLYNIQVIIINTGKILTYLVLDESEVHTKLSKMGYDSSEYVLKYLDETLLENKYA